MLQACKYAFYQTRPDVGLYLVPSVYVDLNNSGEKGYSSAFAATCRIGKLVDPSLQLLDEEGLPTAPLTKDADC